LFLTQLFATKFIPPLNEVAFPAYARIQHDKGKLAYSFLKAVRLIMLVAFPLYLGMAVTAAPFVATLMGDKWLEATPIVAILALAMPVATLQFLFQPAINALGLPGITMRNSIAGAIIMPLVYLVAIRFGATGLAWGWLVSFPLLLAFTIYQAKPHIGFGIGQLFSTIVPGFGAALAMAAMVWLFDRYLVEVVMPWLRRRRTCSCWQRLALRLMERCCGLAHARLLGRSSIWWFAASRLRNRKLAKPAPRRVPFCATRFDQTTRVPA